MKQKVLLIAAIMMALMIPKVVGAYSFSAVAPTGQTLYYNISGSNVSVTYPGSETSYNYSGFTRPSGTLTIPSSVTHYGNTYTVTSIGNYAFYNCTGLTSVNIPNSVTQIGDHSFRSCMGLTSLTIPNSVTSIGNDAFYSCMGLTSLTIPNSVTSIGNRAFSGCGLTSLTIPNSVISIGNRAFITCKSLTSIVVASDNIYYDSRDSCNAIIETSTNTLIAGCRTTVIPNSVTSIAAYVFSNLDNMLSVTIPNSVTSIGEYAFFWCSSLTSVTIPDSVTSIGSQAFYRVRHIEYHGSATGSPWGANSMNGYTEGDFVYSDSTRTNLIAYISTDSNVVIPNSVTSISSYAFCDCSFLTSVTIPNSVTSIGDSAFYNCSSLTSIIIPDSVSSIGNHAFCNCRGLTWVTISNSVTSIGEYTFRDCRGLTSVTIPNSVTSIGNYAFYDCRGLTSVTIPNSVTSIGNYAFAYCNNLTSATISNSVTSIGSRAFFNCSVLTEVTIRSEAAPTLGSQAFDANGSGRIFNIPCGSYNSYYNGSGWTSHRSALHEIIMFELLVNTNDSTKGVASIVQQIGYINPCDSSAIIIATANYGYHFDHWSNGNIANPDTLYLVGDSTVTAIFVANQYVLTVQSIDDSLGSVTGSGTYEYLDSRTISATANYGYHFSMWSDGDTTNPRVITLTQDTAFTALFDKNTYGITVLSTDTVKGYADGTGILEYLDTVTLTATANYGYHFTQWSDGNTDNPRMVQVTRDSVFTAQFDYNQYSIALTVDTTIHGTVNGAGNYNYLSQRTLTAIPNYGYHFTQWNDGDTNNPRVITLTQDTAFTALFDKNQYLVTLSVNDTALGIVTGDGTYNYLDTVTLTATCTAEHHHFVSWNDGITEASRTIVLANDTAFTALFAIDTHSVTLAVNDDLFGSVSGMGNYPYGAEVAIEATANEGYHFLRWSDNNTEATRTVTVTADMSFTAYFESDGTEGIGEVGEQRSEVRVYAVEGRIIVEGAEGETVRVYDVMGRMVTCSSRTYAPALTGTPSNLEGEFRVPTSGVYFVKVGQYPARKVVVIR